MAWYDKYMSIYGKPFDEVSPNIVTGIKSQIASMQAIDPLVSIVVCAYNEEKRLAACLWSLSEIKSKYPIEILGVNNNSADKTEDIYKVLGVPYFNEPRQSPGYARQCGLQHARGKYHFYIDADTFYPAEYVDKMMEKLTQPEVACVSTFWSFYPDKYHSLFSLYIYELIRDIFLWVQHFKRPELCVRGMVMAFKADYAKQIKIRTDIRRGEDGSLALELKRYGKISFVYNRKIRPITGYGTIGSNSIWKSLVNNVKSQLKGISRVFYQVDHYKDQDDNLVKNK
jgi:glycosyltransferase involved in cell wall biosynthesis